MTAPFFRGIPVLLLLRLISSVAVGADSISARNVRASAGVSGTHLLCGNVWGCVHPLAPSARGLRPQAVGERTVRLSEIFRAMARFSPSAPSGHLPRRGRLFDTLSSPPRGAFPFNCMTTPPSNCNNPVRRPQTKYKIYTSSTVDVQNIHRYSHFWYNFAYFRFKRVTKTAYLLPM